MAITVTYVATGTYFYFIVFLLAKGWKVTRVRILPSEFQVFFLSLLSIRQMQYM